MILEAIVYNSNTGYTAKYARLLGKTTGLSVYPLDEAKNKLKKGTSVIYLGWIFASHIKGYKKAAKRFNIKVVCGVGLCDTGTLLEQVRKANSLPLELPLFTLQGGMDISNLHGIKKLIINMLTKGLADKDDRTADENRMFELLKKGGDYVSESNLEKLYEFLQLG